MSEDEKRQRPLGAVPAVLVAVAGVALAGAVLSLPGLGGRPEVAAAQPSGRAATSPAPPNGRAVTAAALDKALPPVRPIDHQGCRIVNPDPPHPIDIVFVTASGGTGKAYLMPRTLCDPPWLEDPERALEEAIDAVLGRPYP